MALPSGTPVELASDHWVLVVWRKQFLVPAQTASLQCSEEQVFWSTRAWQALGLPVVSSVFMGEWRARPCHLIVLPNHCKVPVASVCSQMSLRRQLGTIDDDLFAWLGRAMQLAHWCEHHRFCGRCGSRTKLQLHERVLACGVCAALYYPPVAPCVIGIVVREGRCLLARHTRHPEGVFSVLAGFVEPGENAEQALAREIREEVGLEVGQIDYVCSQSWPFPSQLMLGFVAEYHSGEICADGEEILQADWFLPTELPKVPPAATISGKLIQWFLQRATLRG